MLTPIDAGRRPMVLRGALGRTWALVRIFA
jgi:hypothetical protein